MAVKKVGKNTNYTIQELIGLSTDTKPTTYDPGSTFYETDTKNTYIFDGAAWQEKDMQYKDLGLAIDATNIAAGATVYSNWIDGVQWVRTVTLLCSTDQQYDIYFTVRDSSGTIGSDVSIVTAQAAASGWWRRHYANNQYAYSVRFGIKNVSASLATNAKLKVQLVGI